MDLEAIVRDIDAEISRLEKVRALLTGHTAPLKRGMPDRKRKPVSAEARARIAAAQKKRWAKAKRKGPGAGAGRSSTQAINAWSFYGPDS